jgi:hypothetical protein
VVYSKYEKYVVTRGGDGEDADGRRADGAYGAAYAALLDSVNALMQVRGGEEEGEKEGGKGAHTFLVSHSLAACPWPRRKRPRCARRRTGRPGSPECGRAVSA